MITIAGVMLAVGIGVALRLARPADDALVGTMEASVRSRLGMPEREFAGHFGNPPNLWASKFTGEIKSATFKVWGGRIYVSFERRNGQWITITNHFLPKGAAY